ncbi:MAG: STAS domain-containing protein [Alphaproteobacteria bacterium]|nr:STAS domain-containing protein [Alphaproteobacteria bacterium]
MTAEAQLSVHNEDDYVLISFSGFIDASVVQMARPVLLEKVPPTCGHIIIDLAGVDFLDSHGVGLFVSLLKRAHANRGHLYFAGADGQPASVLRMVGFSNGDLVSYSADAKEAAQQAAAAKTDAEEPG